MCTLLRFRGMRQSTGQEGQGRDRERGKTYPVHPRYRGFFAYFRGDEMLNTSTNIFL